MYVAAQHNCHTIINNEIKKRFAGLVVDLQCYTSMRYRVVQEYYPDLFLRWSSGELFLQPIYLRNERALGTHPPMTPSVNICVSINPQKRQFMAG